jgi:hypothetical protein
MDAKLICQTVGVTLIHTHNHSLSSSLLKTWTEVARGHSAAAAVAAGTSTTAAAHMPCTPTAKCLYGACSSHTRTTPSLAASARRIGSVSCCSGGRARHQCRCREDATNPDHTYRGECNRACAASL